MFDKIEDKFKFLKTVFKLYKYKKMNIFSCLWGRYDTIIILTSSLVNHLAFVVLDQLQIQSLNKKNLKTVFKKREDIKSQDQLYA